MFNISSMLIKGGGS
ncbi:ACD_00320 [African swine fever virus]